MKDSDTTKSKLLLKIFMLLILLSSYLLIQLHAELRMFSCPTYSSILIKNWKEMKNQNFKPEFLRRNKKVSYHFFCFSKPQFYWIAANEAENEEMATDGVITDAEELKKSYASASEAEFTMLTETEDELKHQNRIK